MTFPQPIHKLVMAAYDILDPSATSPGLGELTEAKDKRIRVVDQATGEGRLSINRNSEQAAWVAPGNYVRVWWDTVGDNDDAIFGWWVEPGTDIVLTEDEKVGEELAVGGRGAMAMLEWATLDSVSSIPDSSDGPLPENSDNNNMWCWTRNPGSILTRMMEEAQARGMWEWLDASEFWDFDRTDDSNGDPWTSDPDPPEVCFPVGMDYLTAVAKHQAMGLYVYMEPGSFAFHAWDTEQGVGRAITFTEGVNIVGEVSRDIHARGVMSTVLVSGDARSGRAKYRRANDAGVLAVTGRREGYVRFGATATNKYLDKVGTRTIAHAKRRYDGPATLSVVIRENELPFVDYLPGDTVAVDIPGTYNELAAVISAIAVAEGPTGRVTVVVEFAGDDPVESAGSTDAPSNPCGDCPCSLGIPLAGGWENGTDPTSFAWGGPPYLAEYYGVVHMGTSDGSGESFGFGFPFAPGTITVFVDGLQVPPDAAVPLTGDFTLPAGPTGEVYASCRLTCVPDAEPCT